MCILCLLGYVLYCCNMVRRTWWDWSLILRTTILPIRCWHCWLGHLAYKNPFPIPIWPTMCFIVGRYKTLLNQSTPVERETPSHTHLPNWLPSANCTPHFLELERRTKVILRCRLKWMQWKSWYTGLDGYTLLHLVQAMGQDGMFVHANSQYTKIM